MKNVIFSIFRYKLSKLTANESRMNWSDGLIWPKDYPTLEDYFEALLPQKGKQLPVYDKGKTARQNVSFRMVADDTTIAQDRKEYHRSDILAHKDKITVLTVQANGSKHYIDRNNMDHKMPHYPSTTVIIDNRPGHQLIVIEHSHKASAMEPSRIVHLLLNHFNAQMPQVGVQIQIDELTRVPDFYEACDDIVRRLHDEVRKVELSFPSDNKYHHDRTQELQSFYFMQEFLSPFAYRGHLSALIRSNKAFMSEKTRKTFGLIAQMCAQHEEYFLRVKFENFGWFQYGQETVAQFGISKNTVEEFTGQKIPDNEIFEDDDDNKKKSLNEWLSDITNVVESYAERPVSKRKVKKRYSRSLSA